MVPPRSFRRQIRSARPTSAHPTPWPSTCIQLQVTCAFSINSALLLWVLQNICQWDSACVAFLLHQRQPLTHQSTFQHFSLGSVWMCTETVRSSRQSIAIEIHMVVTSASCRTGEAIEKLSQLIFVTQMFSRAAVWTNDRGTESKHVEPFASCPGKRLCGSGTWVNELDQLHSCLIHSALRSTIEFL